MESENGLVEQAAGRAQLQPQAAEHLTVSLAEVDRSAGSLVGGKGANLGELARSGFPVPDSFILTTHAYALAARAARVDPADPAAAAERLRTSPVPEAIAAAARKAYAALGSGRVAVRSSATAGAVDPDHYAVETATRKVVQRAPAGKGAVLSDGELLAVAELGDRVERHFGAPQDIEFALDRDRQVWLVQSRPITTLYPLPGGAPDPERELRVYFSANVFQGYFEPLTPMGIQFFRLLGTAISGMFGASIDDAAAGPRILKEAGMRIFVDVMPIVRDPVGRPAFVGMTSMGEARSSIVLTRLASDARLPLASRSRLQSVRAIGGALMRAGVQAAALRLMRSPDNTRERYVREMEAFARIDLPRDATASQRLDALERLILTASPRMFPRLIWTIGPAMLSFGLAGRLLHGNLVAPSTDPGWTPLFLTAGALVMEMGSMMSHGAVVAREYGIPAVVGVAGATEQITTGRRVTVDGSAGTVVLEAEPEDPEDSAGS